MFYAADWTWVDMHCTYAPGSNASYCHATLVCSRLHHQDTDVRSYVTSAFIFENGLTSCWNRLGLPIVIWARVILLYG